MAVDISDSRADAGKKVDLFLSRRLSVHSPSTELDCIILLFDVILGYMLFPPLFFLFFFPQGSSSGASMIPRGYLARGR